MSYPEVNGTSHPGYYSNGGSMHLMKHEGYHDNVNPASFAHQHLQHHACLATADHHQTQSQFPINTRWRIFKHITMTTRVCGVAAPQHQYQPPQQDVQISRLQLPTTTDPRTQVTSLNDVKNHPVCVTSSSLMKYL